MVSWRGQGHGYTGHYILKLDDHHLPIPNTHFAEKESKTQNNSLHSHKKSCYKVHKAGQWPLGESLVHELTGLHI